MSDLQTKQEIFYFLNKNKHRFLNNKNNDKTLSLFLLKHNIVLPIEITLHNVVDYLLEPSEKIKKCRNEGCQNLTTFKQWPGSKYKTGYSMFCSIECCYIQRSIRQKGANNTVHTWSKETMDNVKSKLSIIIKNKIATGKWTPNITNSWAGSKVKLNINNVVIKYRSSWDAFFHLCNQHLEYEKLIIQYNYKESWYNYITDFVDHKNKIFYEIKPTSNLYFDRNKAKFEYAEIWAKEHDYEFKIISDMWFKENVNNNRHLLENQEDKEIIIKRLNKVRQ